MIKKFFLLFLAAVLSVAISCSKEEAKSPQLGPKATPPSSSPSEPSAEMVQDTPQEETFPGDGVLGNEDWNLEKDESVLFPSETLDGELAVKPPAPTVLEQQLDEMEAEQVFPPTPLDPSAIISDLPENSKSGPDLEYSPRVEYQQELPPTPEDLADQIAEAEENETPISQTPLIQKKSVPPPIQEKLRIVDLVDPINYWNSGGTIWDAVFVGSQQVGFQSSDFSTQKIQGLPAKRVLVKNQINTQNLHRPQELTSVHSSFETLDGDLIGCQSKIKNGLIMYEQSAKVINDELELETKLAENSAKRKMPWKSPGKIGGCCTIQISLYKQPMQDREERRLSFFDPNRQSIVNTVLAARGIEQVDVFGKPYTLQRIDAVLQSRLDQVPCTFWCDRIGSIIKMSTPFLEGETLTTYRSTKKEIEKFAIESSLIGIERMPIIPLSNAIVNPSAMDEITYIVSLKGNLTPQVDPSTLFPNTANQTVLSVGRNTVRITVRSQIARNPALNAGYVPVEKPVTENSLYTRFDVDPNFWINSNDPEIVQISNDAINAATAAVGNTLSPWNKATALERWVFDNTKWKTNAGFQTASEVARQKEADSIGYGILLTALSRAQKIPTRVAVGLIYVNDEPPTNTASDIFLDLPNRGTLEFHLWNEMLIENQWTPFDATYGLGGASAARIKVADSDLESTSFVSIASEVLRLAGNLDVEIDSASMKEDSQYTINGNKLVVLE